MIALYLPVRLTRMPEPTDVVITPASSASE